MPHLMRGMWSGACAWALLLLLAGCSGGSAPGPLPDLHLAGVRKLPGIDHLHPGSRQGEITDVGSYLPAGGLAPVARVLFRDDDLLYDMGLDGSTPHQVGGPCTGLPAVALYGRMAACATADGVVVLPITSITNASGGTGQPSDVVALPAPAGVRLSDPTWSPDAATLAVVSSQSGCSIAFYALAGGGSTASSTASSTAVSPTPRLAALLVFPGFASGPSCAIRQLTWSPDGTWLAFEAAAKPYDVRMFGLSLLVVLPQARDILVSHAQATAGTPLPTRTVMTDELADWGPGEAYASLTWRPTRDVLAITFVLPTESSDNIMQLDIRTNRQVRLLRVVPAGKVVALAWTPDGRSLIFTYGRYQCMDCASPPYPASRLYVFTPQSPEVS